MKLIKAKLITYDIDEPEVILKKLELHGAISWGEESKNDRVLWFSVDECEGKEVLRDEAGNQLQIEISVADILKQLLRVAKLPLQQNIMKDSE